MKALFTAAPVALGLVALAMCAPWPVTAATAADPPTQLAQYNPYPPPGYPPPPPSYGRPPCNPAGGAFYGAARGAAGGAIFGGIAGNAGKGAAIGAAVGGLAGASRRAAAQSYGYCY
jgi:hypothetical protein